MRQIIKGIYKITSPNNKIYIGQSIDILNRFSSHRSKNIYKLKKLHASFNSYGINNHKFDIISVLPNDCEQDVLNKYEQIYMDFYRNCNIELLNIKEGGNGYGKHSEETKKIIKEKRAKQIFSEESKSKRINTLKKVIHTKEWNAKVGLAQIGKVISEITKVKLRKSILQYDLNGNFIKEWDSSRNASKFYNTRESNICNCLRGNAKTAKGFKWQYKI
jgi:group I intron endonuclease